MSDTQEKAAQSNTKGFGSDWRKVADRMNGEYDMDTQLNELKIARQIILAERTVPELIAIADNVLALNKMQRLDMRELSPDAPHYTCEADRCPTRSQAHPECRCILQIGHVKQGFMYCQFNRDDVYTILDKVRDEATND